MTTAISLETRQRIIQAYKDNIGTQQYIARIFKITVRTVSRFIQMDREGESLAPKQRSGRPRLLDKKQMKILKNVILSNPDKTLIEYCEIIKNKTGVRVSRSVMGALCQELDLRRKKKSFHASEQDRPDVKKKDKILSKH